MQQRLVSKNVYTHVHNASTFKHKADVKERYV